MLEINWTRVLRGIAIVGIWGSTTQLFVRAAEPHAGAQDTIQIAAPIPWQSPARLHRPFPLSKERGTLSVDVGGVEFRSESGKKQIWKPLDIQDLEIAPRKLVLHTYGTRGLHRLGADTKEFDLEQTVSPAVAASLAAGVGRPSRNKIPKSASSESGETAAIYGSIPAHHRTPFGGTNGILRFRAGGIDYITSSPGDSRSWRWNDLQTLASEDLYRLSVFGYLDTYNFDLKEPLDRSAFDRATAELSRHAQSPSAGQVPVNQQKAWLGDSAFRK